MSSTGGPTTWFAGKSAPEDRKGPSPLTLLVVACMLYSPLGAVAMVACYVAFNYYRVSHKVIAGIAALYVIPYAAAVAMFSSSQAMFAQYNAPTRALLGAIKHHRTNGWISSHWWFWFTHQIWFSLALGLTAGAAWTAWKWVRRPEWEDNDRIPGPVHRLRRRRAIAQIASDLRGPTDGATLGVEPYGQRVVQTMEEAAAHTLLAGGSGSGKTTTMMVGIRDAIRRGEAVCVVDMKGAADLPVQVGEWCQRYGRRFLHWSITDRRVGYDGPADGPAFYDPIGRGDASRKKDLLIGSEKWDVEYYKSVNENYLQIAFQIAELVPNTQTDAFSDLAALLDTDKLKKRAAALFAHAPKTPEGQTHGAAHGLNSKWWEMYPTVLDPYVQEILSAAADILIKPEESERSAIRNMSARVQKLRQSTAGAWLKRDPEHGRDIDLRRVADEGWVVVFSLDSAKYKATSAQVGGLIIQDLNTMSGELRAKPAPLPFHVYVDEFSAIGSDNIIDLLARARDARMPCMLSTQALADLKKADPAFLEQALGIVNSFIIHRANTEADADIFAGLTGKKKVYVKRYNVEMASGMPGGIGTGAATGQGMIQQEEDYVVPASAFQDLKRGEMVYIAKSPKNRVVYPVTVIREDEALVAQAIASGAATLTAPSFRETAPTPFTPTEDDTSEAFPSPWPVMAADLYETNDEDAAGTPDAELEARAEFVPVALHEIHEDLVESRRVPAATGMVDLSDFDHPDEGQAVVLPGVARVEVKKEPRAPIIDVSAYRGDMAFPSTSPAPPHVSVQGAGVARAAATEQEALSVPITPTVDDTVFPTVAHSSAVVEEASVFGGGSVEWEDHAASWDEADLGLPTRPANPLRRGFRTGQ